MYKSSLAERIRDNGVRTFTKMEMDAIYHTYMLGRIPLGDYQLEPPDNYFRATSNNGGCPQEGHHYIRRMLFNVVRNYGDSPQFVLRLVQVLALNARLLQQRQIKEILIVYDYFHIVAIPGEHGGKTYHLPLRSSLSKVLKHAKYFHGILF